MFSSFAYSREMQIILMLLSFVFNFALMYMAANLIMRIYGEEASIKQKSIFAFLTGTILQSVWIYLVYYIGGMHSFTFFENLLISSPNPITALIYCYIGIKVLDLSPLRSIELMGHVYIYFTLINCLNRLAGSLIFVQSDPTRFNYLLDAARHVFNFFLSYMIYRATNLLIDKNPSIIISKASTIARPKTDLVYFISKACFVYLCVVAVPLLVGNVSIAYTLIFIILTFFFATTVLLNFYSHEKANVQNKEVHINSLLRSTDEFRAIKHDFNNILQTYSGYFAIGDLEACKKYHKSLINLTTLAGDALDLSRRMMENPALISLMIEKQAQAECISVKLNLSIKCSVADFPLSEIEMSRVIACLLDNAIEAAEESEQRRVSVTIDQKMDGSRLIIITNSTSKPIDISLMFTSGITTKAGHQGIGINNVRKIIDNHVGCSFQLNYYNNEVNAYIELRNKN